MYHFYTSVTDICDRLKQGLYEPVQQISDDMLGDLIEANNKITGKQSNGFRHLSEFYSPDLLGNERYSLPVLDDSLEEQFQDYESFVTDSKNTLMIVNEFLKKVLFHAIDNSHAENSELDLGDVLPERLLSTTNLLYSINPDYKIPNDLKDAWAKYDPYINKLLALRIVLK